MRLVIKNLSRVVFTVHMAAFFGLFFWSAYWIFEYEHAHIYAEHGLLEKIQAIVLAIAILAFLKPVLFENRPDKLILLFCALLGFSFLLRELDVKNLDIHPIFIIIGSGIGRIVILGTAFISMAIYAGFRFSYYKSAAIRFLRTNPGLLLIMGGIFLLLGDFFEKINSINHHIFFEEISELFAYTCISLSAFTVNSSQTHALIPANDLLKDPS